eukprot:13807997-Alexandrium_andersonii.AAC.1
MHPSVAPCMLADGLMVAAGVKQQVEQHELGHLHLDIITVAIRYLQDMGAKVSAKKCWSVSSSAGVRGVLKR